MTNLDTITAEANPRAAVSRRGERRGEWSALLLVAVCALLCASPVGSEQLAASSLAASLVSSSLMSSSLASSAPARYEVVLRCLHCASSGAAVPADGSYEGILLSSGETAAVDAQQMAALLAAVEVALPASNDSQVTLPAVARHLSAGSTQLRTDAGSGSTLSGDFRQPGQAPRYDGSRLLPARALTPHEAATRCGSFTLRFLE